MKYQKPKRRFERTGFVNPEKSYYVQIEDVKNADNDDMKTMVECRMIVLIMNDWTTLLLRNARKIICSFFMIVQKNKVV